jgi:hypothetical protein
MFKLKLVRVTSDASLPLGKRLIPSQTVNSDFASSAAVEPRLKRFAQPQRRSVSLIQIPKASGRVILRTRMRFRAGLNLDRGKPRNSNSSIFW